MAVARSSGIRALSKLAGMIAVSATPGSLPLLGRTPSAGGVSRLGNAGVNAAR
jgi:hypothetical protein